MFDLSKSGFGQQSQHARYAMQKIPCELILSNEKNFYSVDDVDALAESIRISGLLEPVTVVKTGDRAYRMISGHRRLKAYRQNAEKCIPAFVVEPDDLDELTMLITANSTQRKLTTAEMLEQDRQLREVYAARKAAGKEVPKNLSETIAKQMGISRNEESRLNNTNKALIQAGKELVKDGMLNASQSYAISRKDQEQQAGIIQDIKAGTAVREAIRKAEEPVTVPEPGPENEDDPELDMEPVQKPGNVPEEETQGNSRWAVYMYQWETRKITDDGDYACEVSFYGKTMKRILYMRGGVLRIHDDGVGIDENISVVKWIRLPD